MYVEMFSSKKRKKKKCNQNTVISREFNPNATVEVWKRAFKTVIPPLKSI